MTFFVDTSALYALMDADDKNHDAAKGAWASWLQEEADFATSNYVLLEGIALVQRRLGVPAVRGFCEGLLPVLRVQWVDPAIHASALTALLTAGRRDLSLVDCTSFEIMRTHGIRAAFAFDPHFAEQGFEQLP